MGRLAALEAQGDSRQAPIGLLREEPGFGLLQRQYHERIGRDAETEQMRRLPELDGARAMHRAIENRKPRAVDDQKNAIRMAEGGQTYEVWRELSEFGSREAVPLPKAWVFKYAKAGGSLDEEDMKKFSLQDAKRTSAFSESKDGDYLFFLLFGGKRIARISFDAIDGGVRVVQMQGARGHEGAAQLGWLKWTRMLLDYVCEWAASLGVGKVEVLGSANNIWVGPGHMDPKHAFMVYDVTAKRAGFTPTAQGNYVKEMPRRTQQKVA